MVVSISIDATVRQWSVHPRDLAVAKEKVGKEEEEEEQGLGQGEDKGKGKGMGKGVMTEEEERELDELMMGDG